MKVKPKVKAPVFRAKYHAGQKVELGEVVDATITQVDAFGGEVHYAVVIEHEGKRHYGWVMRDVLEKLVTNQPAKVVVIKKKGRK